MSNKRNLIITILIVSGISLIVYGLLNNREYNSNSINNSSESIKSQNELAKLIEVLPSDPNVPLELTYREPNFYFPYKDTFYYYDYKTNSLFSMNMDCSNKKLITSSSEMHHPSFYLIYKDEAYFYNVEGYHTEVPKVNKKVNLVSGEVINLNNDYKALPVSFNNGIVTTLGNINVTDSATFRKYNLNTNTVDFENKYKYNINYDYMYDYANGTYYAINNKLNNTVVNIEVYKNDKLLSSFKIDDVYTKQKYGFRIKYLYVDDNALFLTDSVSLYKFDFKTKSIKKSENLILEFFDIFYSNNNDTVYLYNRSDCYVYVLDKESVALNKLFRVPNAKEYTDISSSGTIFYESNIYDTGSNLILPFEANNLRYKTKNDESLGQVIIYDKSSKNSKVIENVRRAFFDYENSVLYIFVKNNSTYNIEKISLK